jgi:peptide/nickel transport system permease protein
LIRFLLQRLLHMVPVVVVVSFVVFATTLLIPGDPAVTMLGEQSTQEQRDELRERMGLNLPVPVQYGRWVTSVASGDLGRSLRTQQKVSEMLLERLPVTLELTVASIALAALVGVPLGLVAAVKRNSWVDAGASFVSMFAMAVPNFWLGILLIVFVSIHLGWLPPSGYVPFSVDPVQNLKMMILPTLTLGLSMAGLVMRQTRASLLEVLSADYVRTARAKGAFEPRVVFHHALRNALVPVITVTGLQISTLLGGAVIVETVFSMPGLGRMIVDGIFERDFLAVQGAILAIVLGILLLNVLIDILYHAIDPRISSR